MAKSKKVRTSAFNILDASHDEFVQDTQTALSKIRAARKNQPTGFKTMHGVQRAMAPYRDISFQWLVGSRGITEGTLMEIIGPEGLGKTTLAFWLMGGAMLAGIPCAYQETEGKPITTEWALRALHSDRKIAQTMLDRIGVYNDVNVLSQMNTNMVDWAALLRGTRKSADAQTVPKSTPILMVVDTMSKIMAPGEAAGVVDYGDLMSEAKKRNKKGVNEGSNLEHAKWHAAWCRRLPHFLAENNIILILISHQTTKVDMTAKPGRSFGGSTSGLFNKSKLGGSAINQNAAMQLILAYKGLAKNSAGEKIGRYVKARCDKNSFGPTGRVMDWILQDEGLVDTAETVGQGLRFEETLANFMADNSYFGTTVSRKRYTCDKIKAEGVTALEFKALLDADEKATAELGALLNIRGYDNVVGDILKQEQ